MGNIRAQSSHVALMILGWCFVLPAGMLFTGLFISPLFFVFFFFLLQHPGLIWSWVGVMFSVARSRFALPTQFLFLIVNAFGMLLGIVYNNQTPDLYPNNAHHKIGWIASSVACAQVVMSLIFTYAGRGDVDAAASERAAFFPVPTDEMAHQPHPYPSSARHSWPRDGGQGTERDSSIHNGPPSLTCVSPSADYVDFEKPEEDDLHGVKPAACRRWLCNAFSRVPGMVPSRVLGVLSVIYMVIDRILLPFGFIAIATGGVTYGGIMVGAFFLNPSDSRPVLYVAHTRASCADT